MLNAKGLAALVACTLQNAGSFLLMRYSKLQRGPSYNNLVAVLMAEVIKLAISLVLFAVECGGASGMARVLHQDFTERPTEWFQLSVPALVYTVQNWALYVGAAERVAFAIPREHADGERRVPAPF